MKVLELIPWGLTSDLVVTTNSEKSAEVIVGGNTEGLNDILALYLKDITMDWWNTRINVFYSQGSNKKINKSI